ncbi:MAG: hypothetical protein ABIJ48_00865 [Actinomycetota bacterium]
MGRPHRGSGRLRGTRRRRLCREGSLIGRIIETSSNDFERAARITQLAPGSPNLMLPPPGLRSGDRTPGMLLSGPAAQVVGLLWTNENLLQFVRVGMTPDDEDRAAAGYDVAQASADRRRGQE